MALFGLETRPDKYPPFPPPITKVFQSLLPERRGRKAETKTILAFPTKQIGREENWSQTNL